ncbi:MAG: hypothetical protein ACE5K2_04975 [Candidatus Zixiibacteriota bacterium]
MAFTDALFLETTLQVERVFGSERIKRLINEAVRGRSLITSTYVLMEFKRTITSDFVNFYNALEQEENISEALAQLAKSYGRHSSRYLLILSVILRERRTLNKEKTLEILSRYIRWDLRRRFYRGIDHVIDETQCPLSVKEPVFENGFYSLDVTCRKGENPCKVSELIRENLEDVKKIFEALKGAPSAKGMVELLGKVVEDPKEMDGRTCQLLGDVVIVLEAPRDTPILTTDRLYRLICEAIGKKYHIFS